MKVWLPWFASLKTKHEKRLIKFALPTGDLRSGAAAFLEANGLGSSEYSAGSRAFRPAADEPGRIAYRVFRERDIPIQVALGNYHAGICSSVAVDEVLARHPNEGIVKLRPLPFGRASLVILVPRENQAGECLTIVSEYPNLAESFALERRIGRYRVLAVNGSASCYPPEDADLALVSLSHRESPDGGALDIVERLSESSACLVANRKALASIDLSMLLAGLSLVRSEQAASQHRQAAQSPAPAHVPRAVRIALPDGHQQREAPEVCRRAGLKLDRYDEDASVARPLAADEDIDVKVIRPQDMPQMVAVGSFDLAITGRDCLLNHLAQFPSSPVEEIANLERQRYRWAAVVDQTLQAKDLESAIALWRARGRETIRIASEYPNLADQFARERHLGHYQVIPVVGASEGFVPEDAEILIEGSETGRTWEANGLVPLEWLFDSTMVLVANKNRQARRNYRLVEQLADRFRQAA
jgi:ATP phosphoribosyltransferase